MSHKSTSLVNMTIKEVAPIKKKNAKLAIELTPELPEPSNVTTTPIKKKHVKLTPSPEIATSPIKKKNVKLTQSPLEMTKSPSEQQQLNHKTLDSSTFDNDYREIMMSYNPKNNISPPVLTDFEIPLIIGKRATQIAYGAAPMIEPTLGMDHVDIAEEELRQKKTPYIVKRVIGTLTEYWKIADMIVDF